MMSNIKALGVAAFSLLAMGAMFASGAQAEVTLTSGLTPSTHTAASVHAVQIGNPGNITTNSLVIPLVGAFHCSDTLSTFTGTTTGTDKDLKITPSYVHCTTITASDTAGTPLTVTTNGCYYTFLQPTSLGGGEYTGNVQVKCEPEKAIEVEIYASGSVTAHATKLCTVSIGEQTISHLIYKQTTTPAVRDDIDVTDTESGVAWSKKGLCGAGEGNNLTCNSELTLTSTSHELWFSGS